MVRSLIETLRAIGVLIGAGEGGVTVVIGPWLPGLQAPFKLDVVSHGFVVRLPDSFAATGPVAAPNQLQVASVSPAPTLRRSWSLWPTMLLRLMSAPDGAASPRSKYGVDCRLAVFPDWIWIPTSFPDTMFFVTMCPVPSTTIPKPSPVEPAGLRRNPFTVFPVTTTPVGWSALYAGCPERRKTAMPA